MVKLIFDYGHGGIDPGAVNGNRKESDDVLKLGRAIAKALRKYGITIHETRTSDEKVTLKQRVDEERKETYNYFISFHRNSAKDKEANGAECYVYLFNNTKSRALASKIQKAMVQIGFKDRGMKKADFQVLRETNSKAILLEIGFITNEKDNELFDKKFNKLVNEIANAICSHVENTPTKDIVTIKCSKCGNPINI